MSVLGLLVHADRLWNAGREEDALAVLHANAFKIEGAIAAMTAAGNGRRTNVMKRDAKALRHQWTWMRNKLIERDYFEDDDTFTIGV